MRSRSYVKLWNPNLSIGSWRKLHHLFKSLRESFCHAVWARVLLGVYYRILHEEARVPQMPKLCRAAVNYPCLFLIDLQLSNSPPLFPFNNTSSSLSTRLAATCHQLSILDTLSVTSQGITAQHRRAETLLATRSSALSQRQKYRRFFLVLHFSSLVLRRTKSSSSERLQISNK